jgi:hypothetical protein
VLVQVVDVLDVAAGLGAGHGDVVEHRQVLNHLAQPDAAGVRAHRHPELRRQKQNGEVLRHPAHPARIDLDHVDGSGLQQLLEDHPVLHVFTRGQPDGSDRGPDAAMAEHVVR